MIKVNLINKGTANPTHLASHAAKVCYEDTAPEFGDTLDVEGRLFRPGHHTTLEHSYYTFLIEGIAVGDITFGLHLTTPFYNSDQRSGRFCAGMFAAPNYQDLESYIRYYWPDVEGSIVKEILDYIRSGIAVYQKNLGRATELTAKLIKEERPNASEKYVAQNAPKIAQEQLRIFIPILFPTAFDFTINLVVLAALYREAWTPTMRDVTRKMVEIVLEDDPSLGYMFERGSAWDFYPPIIDWGHDSDDFLTKPDLSFRTADLTTLNSGVVEPNENDLYPLDLLRISPRFMRNAVTSIKTRIFISAATMGQDQRHRTIRRGNPEFIGKMYLPPVPAELSLASEAVELMDRWLELSRSSGIPGTLATILTPYGSVVTYEKEGDLCALMHEQAKRLCWCAQEEIYHVARQLREEVMERNTKFPLLRVMSPHCFTTGKCAEGVRSCGRVISQRETGDYFPLRKV